MSELVGRHPEWEREIRAFDERWQETVRGVIEGSVALLARLQERGVPTYSITNFSREKFAVAPGCSRSLRASRASVVSAHEKLVKPDPAIYRVFLDRYALNAGRCLFVDDKQGNVDGALAVGMQAVHFRGALRRSPRICAFRPAVERRTSLGARSA